VGLTKTERSKTGQKEWKKNSRPQARGRVREGRKTPARDFVKRGKIRAKAMKGGESVRVRGKTKTRKDRLETKRFEKMGGGIVFWVGENPGGKIKSTAC